MAVATTEPTPIGFREFADRAVVSAIGQLGDHHGVCTDCGADSPWHLHDAEGAFCVACVAAQFASEAVESVAEKLTDDVREVREPVEEVQRRHQGKAL